MSFTSLLHREHCFIKPAQTNKRRPFIYMFILLSVPVCVRGRVWVTFIVRGLVGGFWGCAAALGVLAAAGRLTADFPVFSIHLSLRGDKGVTYLDETAAWGC